jgi:predicted phosphodiesterase
MKFAFDLISDLHLETWNSPFDWTSQATSPYCVVAGDVCRDRKLLIDSLTHLGTCYPGGVFYVDGNDEHYSSLEDLGDSYRQLKYAIGKIPNVVYMQDNVVIINGVAILGTNGWWSYDFDSDIDVDETVNWYAERMRVSVDAAVGINGIAYHDAAYISNSVHKLQIHKEVAAIVMVSHTVPAPWLISHDLDLINTCRFNTLGNSHLQHALSQDTENKIKAWCFGHYHRGVDQDYRGIRWVNNCRGRGNTEWCQQVYYPKRIEIEF